VTSSRARTPIPQAQLPEVCRRHRIRWLALVGSVLRDDFRADSDVDVLIEFPRARCRPEG
jgi:predicted nucleotidyltransferase